MKDSHIFISLIILFSHFCCKEYSSAPMPEVPTPVPFMEVRMQCTDLVSIGGQLNVVIRSQAEYDSLTYERFQKPLDDYWKTNYESVLNSQKQRYPGLSDSAYAVLVRRVFYSFPPFRGTDSCSNPSINFNPDCSIGYKFLMTAIREK
ncbi:MAG: hypothetical protein QME58_10170, partial [Bacteroidota bacterium]|nr:hypothetical protein [Bacteroidota bacterium]